MTVEGILFVTLALSLPFMWAVAGILTTAAYRKPRVMALTVMAVSTVLIAIGLTTYVVAVVDMTLAYPVPLTIIQIVFRLILVGLAAFPIWFLWLYLTGRFDDRVDRQ